MAEESREDLLMVDEDKIIQGRGERPGYAERARPLLAPLAGREAHDSALDVIGGADWESLALLLQSYDLVERKTRNELNPASCLEFFPPLR